MDREQVSLDFPSHCLPLDQACGPLWLCVRVNGDFVEVLQQPNYEEGHLVVSELGNRAMCGVSTWSRREIGQNSYLLANANPGTCVERQENKRVRNEILLHPVIDEPIGIKLVG